MNRRGFLKALGAAVAVGLGGGKALAGTAAVKPVGVPGPRLLVDRIEVGEVAGNQAEVTIHYQADAVLAEQRAILAEMQKAEAYHRRFGEPEAARGVNFLIARLRSRMGEAADGLGPPVAHVHPRIVESEIGPVIVGTLSGYAVK